MISQLDSSAIYIFNDLPSMPVLRVRGMGDHGNKYVTCIKQVKQGNEDTVNRFLCHSV